MRLSGSEDIGLGVEEAFAAVTDPAALERAFLSRGITIARTDEGGAVGPGTSWTAPVTWKGRTHPVTVEIAGWAPPSGVRFHGRSHGLSGDLEAGLAALAPGRTRLHVTLELRGSGMRDRMLLNALTLARGQLARKFEEAVSAFAARAEARTARAP